MGDHHMLRTVLILACINNIYTQYYDLFQALQPFVQQSQPSQPLNFFNDLTTRRPRPKQKVVITGENTRKQERITISDNIHEDNVRKRVPAEQTNKNKQTTRRKQTNSPLFDINFFTTTHRPIKKTTKIPSVTSSYDANKSQVRQEPKNNKDSSAIVFLDEATKSRPNNSRSKTSDSREPSNNSRDKSKPVSRPNNRKTQNQSLIATNYESPNVWYDEGRNTVTSYTTRPPYYETTKTYNYLQNNNKNKNTNYYTTHNPLLHRPGVKPAVVQGPPITNRPVTQRPTFENKPAGINWNDDLNVTPEVISGPDEDYMSAVDKKRYIDIAERMCDKYKSLNVKQVEAIPLVPSPQPVRVNISSCPPTNVPLVVGGKVVSIQEFPHMALLGWRKTKNRGYSWKCGGSLLSNQFILTAAHCAYQDRDDDVVPGPPRIVQLGSSYLNDPKAVFMSVSAVTRHPKYKLPMAYYDLAIVKMTSTVTFSESIKPACLGTPPSTNHPIIATGWGRTEFGGSQSHELRSVSIPVWDISECHNALGVSMKIPYGPSSDSQICAGERSGGKDTCQGDSGGPAQIQEGCIWRVVAVTSVGRLCGAEDTPAIYATVQRAFISAVVFGKETTQTNKNNNNRNDDINNNYQTTNNNQGNGNNNWNNKKINEQSSSGNSNQQNNNFNQQNNGMNDWNRKQTSYYSNTELGTTSSYGNNQRKNLNNNREDSNYNQNNQQNKNQYNSNNYNSQTTDSYSKWNSEREISGHYNPMSSRENENTAKDNYNNYAGNNNNRDNYNRQQSYMTVGRTETYYNGNGNVWWT